MKVNTYKAADKGVILPTILHCKLLQNIIWNEIILKHNRLPILQEKTEKCKSFREVQH